MSFPSSPVNVQTTSTNGIVYTYNSTNSAWKRTPGPTVSGVGVNQTWTDVTASRSAGTTYTNSTGKPITVSVSCPASGTGGTINFNIKHIHLI